MLPHIALTLWFKSSVEKLMCWGVVVYALRHKQSVAARYGNGTFEIVAIGNSTRKRLKKTSGPAPSRGAS
jgi:hypothetical protein